MAYPACGKCGKPIEGPARVEGGKPIHIVCPVEEKVTPVDVQRTANTVVAPKDDGVSPAPDAKNSPLALLEVSAPEMRHIAFFAWKNKDGVVINQTVRGLNFQDFVKEWNAMMAWVLENGTFVNSGRAAYSESPQPAVAATGEAGKDIKVPQSVSDQTTKFEVDGVAYMVGKVREILVKTTTKGDLYLSVKIPPFLVHGVPAYKEVAVPVFGDLQQLSGAPVPITPSIQFAVFSLKEDGKPNKIVEFRGSKNE